MLRSHNCCYCFHFRMVRMAFTSVLPSALIEWYVLCMISRDVFTGNLPSSTAERDIEEEFIRFGTLRSVWVARKPPGFGEGFVRVFVHSVWRLLVRYSWKIASLCLLTLRVASSALLSFLHGCFSAPHHLPTSNIPALLLFTSQPMTDIISSSFVPYFINHHRLHSLL